MLIEEFFETYNDKNVTTKILTNSYNELEVEDRKKVLSILSEQESKSLIKKLRNQAVANFWTHEQELIRYGESTRNWTPEQIEDIMNLSEKTGHASINGDVAYDINGKSYYGHHMIDVSTHSEYAGDWRNIQALDYEEHYNGAHKEGTKVPTEGYYNVADRKSQTMEIPKEGVAVRGNTCLKTAA